MTKYLYSVIVGLWSFSIQAQEILKGRVLDQESNQALVGAHVYSAFDSTYSDAGGYFQIRASEEERITVSFSGYQTIHFQAEGSDRIRIINLTVKENQLDQVIVTAGYVSRKLDECSSAIAMININQLQRDAPFTITPSFNRIPGVYMHSGTIGTNRITIRGIGSRSLFTTDKIRAYYEEIPLTDGSGNSTIEDLDQALMGKILILKGPNSSLYGGGLGGVIQIQNNRPALGQTSAGSDITLGSYGSIRWLTEASHRDHRLTLNLIHSETVSNGYRENNDYQKSQSGVSGRYYLKNASYFNFIGIYTDLRSEIPSSLSEEDFRNRPTSAATNWQEAQGYETYQKALTGISYHYTIGKYTDVSHSINLQTRKTYEPAPRPVNILDDQLVGYGTRNVISHRHEKFNMNAGFEYFQDELNWKTFENLHTPTSNGSVEGDLVNELNEKRSFLNVFSQVAYNPTDKITLEAGFNINTTRYELSDPFRDDSSSLSGTYSYDPIFSPRAGFVYRMKDWFNTYGNISHGFSTPNLEQTLYPDGTINQNIAPETGWNFEAGVRGNRQKFTYDLSAYYMDIRNLLVARRTPDDQYIGVNAGSNAHYGVELYADYSILYQRIGTLRFFTSSTLMNYRFSQFVDDDNDYSGNLLPGVPRYKGSMGVELLSESGINANINAQYVGKMPVTDDNSLYAGDYFLINAQIGYRLRIKRFEIKTSTGVNNILNEKYASMLMINTFTRRYYYPGLPRNYYGSIGVKYLLRDPKDFN